MTKKHSKIAHPTFLKILGKNPQKSWIKGVNTINLRNGRFITQIFP